MHFQLRLKLLLSDLITLRVGPFINYVTLKGGGGGPFSVTLCDREGRRGLVDAYIRMGKKL